MFSLSPMALPTLSLLMTSNLFLQTRPLTHSRNNPIAYSTSALSGLTDISNLAFPPTELLVFTTQSAPPVALPIRPDYLLLCNNSWLLSGGLHSIQWGPSLWLFKDSYNLVASLLPSEWIQRRGSKAQCQLELRSEVTHFHFHHNLFIRSKLLNPAHNSMGRKLSSSSRREKYQRIL